MVIKKSKVTAIGTYQFGKGAEEQIKTKEIMETLCDGTEVEVGTGITISKNYNSCRLDVRVRYPCKLGEEKKAAEKAWDFVADELQGQFEEAQKLLEKLAGK